MGFLNEVKKCSLDQEDEENLENLFYLINENLGFPIFESIEDTKRNLCSKENYTFEFEEGDLFVSVPLTKQNFIDDTEEKIQVILSAMDEVLKEAGVEPHQIDLICCTGGTSKVPRVKEGLVNRFSPEKIQSFKNFHSVIEGLSNWSTSPS